MYVFGQILFLKNHQDSDQIEFIKSIYGWKTKERKAIPFPVIELIDANDDNKKITPYDDSSEKIPVQYITIERAKKIKQEVLYDYREFKEEYFDYLKAHVKNGDKIYNEILKYKKQYSQWIDKHSKVDIDINQSLNSYWTKIVRVYKGDRNCGKAVILRVLNEEGRREIVYIRYLKNSKTEWIDVQDDSEESKDSKITLKYDKIKGVITYDSLRNSLVPKTRLVLPYEFNHQDDKLKILKEGDWHAGLECSRSGIVHLSNDIISDNCEICKEQISKKEYCH